MKEKEDKNKISLVYNLKINALDKEKENNKGYDFVPKGYHWTNLSEQKIKVEEIEDKTK